MNEEKLFDAYLRNELSHEEIAFLIHKLEEDHEFGSRLVQYIFATGRMIQSAEQLASLKLKISTGKTKIKRSKQSKKRRSSLPFLMALASAAVFIFCFMNFKKTDIQINQSFSLTSFISPGAYYKGYSSGQKMISLEKGEILEFTNGLGSRVVIEGPSVFRLESDFLVFLESGKAAVFVAKGNEGLKLETPISVIEDLGTAFGCEINHKEMDVHVFEGLVELGERKQRVEEGEAYALNEYEDYRKIPYDGAKFLKSIHSFEEKDNILRVGETIYLNPYQGEEKLSFVLTAEKFSDFENADYEVEFYGDGKRLTKVDIDENFKNERITLTNVSGIDELTVFLDGKSEDYAEGKVTIKVLGKAFIPEPLVETESYWHYQQSKSSMSPTWYKSQTVPKGWLRGRSGIGFGRTVNTEVAERDVPLYMYKEFDLKTVPTDGFLILTTLFDDGGIVYLNGREIHRENCEDLLVGEETRVSKRRHDSNSFRTVKLPALNLKQGKNILTVAIAQYEGTSKDMYFDLRLLYLKSLK